ncbi:glutathione S-transferase N-terminal domain-containing protein [Myxococcus stipitatus]|uniref:glutathione S-transferase N-terminal domain-containing protein n=1 Tax=Myxococcus stipitatus TaxID=83455 RepID=UPI0030CC184D
MKVHGHPMSTCTRKVLTTLAEKGHEATFVLVDLAKGEQKSPAHLARQPFGVVPVLEAMEEGRRLVRRRGVGARFTAPPSTSRHRLLFRARRTWRYSGAPRSFASPS